MHTRKPSHGLAASQSAAIVILVFAALSACSNIKVDTVIRRYPSLPEGSGVTTVGSCLIFGRQVPYDPSAIRVAKIRVTGTNAALLAMRKARELGGNGLVCAGTEKEISKYVLADNPYSSVPIYREHLMITNWRILYVVRMGPLLHRTTWTKTLYREHYAGGKLFREVPLREGLPHGRYRRWDQAGRLAYEAEFRNGFIVNGVISVYNFKGGVSQTIPIRDGKWHGVMKAFMPSGELAYTSTYRNGLLIDNEPGVNAPWTIQIDGKTPHSAGTLKRDKPSRSKKAKRPSVLLKEEIPYDSQGRVHGAVKTYRDYKLRNETSYREGFRHGPDTLYFEDGVVQRLTTYARGVEHGPYRYNHSDGTPSDIYTNRNGLIEGRRVQYLGRSISSEETYRRGLLHGPQVTYWIGKLEHKAEYLSGFKHGIQRHYDPTRKVLLAKERFFLGYPVNPTVKAP